MFIPTIYLSPTCPFMTSELLASVCQSGKSSLANASLLASRFGKNRHCWKKCFSHCCVWIRSSLDKVFPATELRPFFSNTCSMSLYQLLVLVFCKQFCARSREMDIWKHKTVFCKLEPQWNNSKRHFAPRTLAVAVSGGQTDIPKWNCRLQLFANWLITGWQLHLQAKSTNWGEKKQYEIIWSLKCFRLLACKLWRCSKFERGTTL